MKFVIWTLGLFGMAVAVVFAMKHPGYVLIVSPPYRIELTLTLFIVILLLGIPLLMFVLRQLIALLRLPSEVRQFRARRAEQEGRAAMMEALTAFFEGRYAAAERAAVKAMESGDQSGINPIIAARSAHELNEFSKRDEYLSRAEGKSVGEATMKLIARTEFMLDQKQPQQAIATLQELQTSGKYKHIGALQLELKAHQQARNWKGTLDVLQQLEKRSAIDTNIAAQLRHQAWQEMLKVQPGDLTTLRSLWKSIPSQHRNSTRLAALAAANFIRLQDCKTARQILTDSLEQKWDSELVAIFGDCQDPDNSGQIEQAEKWLPQHSNDAGLLLALGKLCLYHGLWGKAQSYLEASISIRPSRAGYDALAQLSDKIAQPDAAQSYRQKALTLE